MKRVLVVILSYISIIASAQEVFDYGYPLITNYLPEEYDAHAQVWCTEQDEEGKYYFGCGDGLLTFDGNTWSLVRLPNKTTVRSIKYNNGLLYVGAIGDFGYFTKGKQNTFQYTSIKNNIAEQYQTFGDVWQIELKDNKVFFLTDKYLFVWDELLKTINVFEASNFYHWLFNLTNEIYVTSYQEGFFKYNPENETLVEITGTKEFLSKEFIYGFPKFSNNWQVVSRHGIFKYNGSEFKSLKTSIDSILKNNRVYNYKKLPSNNSIIGTGNGLYVVTPEFQKLLYLSDKSGLSGNDIGNSYIDKKGRLWLGTFNGISELSFQEPLRVFDQRSGLNGFIEDIIEIEGQLFLGTSKGVALLTEKGKITYLPQIKNHVFKLAYFKNQLLAATANGLIAIDTQTNTSKILSKKYGRDLIIYQNKVLYATNDSGILAYNLVNNHWQYDSVYQTIPTSISRYFYKSNNGSLWVSNTADKVFSIENPQTDSIKYQMLGAENNVPVGDIRFREIKGQFYFTSESGVFQLENNVLTQHKGFVTYLKNQPVIDLFEDNKHNIFIVFGSTANMRIRQIKIAADSVWELPSKVNLIKNTSTWAHLADSKGNIWFGGTKGLYLYNFNKDNNIAIDPKLSLVVNFQHKSRSYSNDSIIQLPYDSSSVEFLFTIPNYPSKHNEYRYRLRGLSNTWSSWTNGFRKDFVGLRDNTYRFEVQGRTQSGELTPINYAIFKISPPWYLSYPFLAFLFFITVSFLSWAIGFFSTRKLIRKLEVLELQEKVRSERERISSDLHDNVGAQLTSLVSGLEMVENINNRDKQSQLISSLKDDAKISITHLRDTIWTLYKEEVRIQDFYERIAAYLQHYFEHTDIEIKINTSIDVNCILNPEDSLQLMRAIQEIAQNVLKHSEASSFITELKSNKQHLELSFIDNGKGFDYNTVGAQNKFGINNIKERITKVNGKYELQTAPEKGTSWQLRIPQTRYGNTQ